MTTEELIVNLMQFDNVEVVETDDTITIKIKKESDTKLKTRIKGFKRNTGEMPDKMFKQFVAKLKSKINTKEFDDLINKESFTKEESIKLNKYIDIAEDIAAETVEAQIKALQKLAMLF